jgi:hypothetical protein
MNNNRLFFLILAAAMWVCGAKTTRAQESSSQVPPPLLRITRVLLKPGRMADYEKIAEARANALKKANWSRSLLTLPAVTGPEEVWLLTLYDSLEGWDKDREEINKQASLKAELDRLDREASDLILSKSEIRTHYHPDISYRPNFDWSQMRCLSTIELHIHPGHHSEYVENRKITLAGHQKGGIDEHLMVYTVAAGDRSATYFILRPVASLHALELMEEAHGKGGEVLTPEEHKRMVDVFASSVESEQEEIYCVDPKATYLTKSWANGGVK